MNNKVYINGTETDKKTLRKFLLSHQLPRVHHRAQAILWSIEGKSRTELAALFSVKADTISDWFKRWNPHDLTTFHDEHRAGRPPNFTESEKKPFRCR